DRYACEAWRTRRRRWLQANPLCVACTDQGRAVPATVVDHMNEAESSGDFNRFLFTDRLQSLCWEHHEVRHGRRAGGKRTWIAADGLPVLDQPAFGQRPASTR